MKVCFLLQNDFPPDPRLSRTASVLIKHGHEVELFCDNRRGGPQQEIVEGIRVYRLRHVTSNARGIGRLLRLPIFWNPIWISQFLKFAKRGNFDVIHAINLTMAPLGLLAARLLRIPLVYDMFENYPAAIRSWKLRGVFNHIFRNAAAAELLDRFCVRAVDHLIVVTEEAKQRALALGTPSGKITVVYNTPQLDAMTTQTIREDIAQRYKKNFTIVYSGIVSSERGLETAIEAMQILSSSIPNAKLVIVGGGPSEQALRELTIQSGLQSCVEITGWMDHNLLPSYVAAADVCIVPHPANPFIDTTMPNKLFEYMAMSKPVVVSDAKPLARIVHECKCGAVFTSGSAESFAEAILHVRTNGHDYGEHGRQAVREKYNWETSSQTLIDLYKRLILSRP
jgi:glycosyltransferase involved in cell wall biosynthesis